MIKSYTIAFSKENNGPLSLKEFAKQLGGYSGFILHQSAGSMIWRCLKDLIGEFRGNYYKLGVIRKMLKCLILLALNFKF